jgi:hypothetical protein
VLVDFALLSGAWAAPGEAAPDAVVCAMRCVGSSVLHGGGVLTRASSMVCDVAALGFGWAGAFGLQDGDRPDGSWDETRRRWVDVENGGVVSPVWKALQLF